MFRPLFLTSLSLSSTSAIGVQTKLMLEEFPDWRHLYWDSYDFKVSVRHSARVESNLFAWYHLLRQDLGRPKTWEPAPQSADRAVTQLQTFALPRLGLSWWKDNALKPHREAQIRNEYSDSVSAVYAAPLSIGHCERMKSILMTLRKPFVVHLWDIMDKEQGKSSAFQWLLRNAAHAFCLSESMIEYVAPIRPDATILRFSRSASTHSSAPSENRTIRIALIGVCEKYRDGLSLLGDALSILRGQKIAVEIVYVGPEKNIRGWPSYVSEEVRATGFLPSEEARDRALAECQVGFLPGPLAPPAENNYSRFSIPSRILDYLAVGLPLAATIHPDSATAVYLTKIGLQRAVTGASAETLAEKLFTLCEPDFWRTQSEMSRCAFSTSQAEKGDLKYWLEHIANRPYRSRS